MPRDPRRPRRERARVRSARPRPCRAVGARVRCAAGRAIEAAGCPALLGEVAAVLGRERLRRYLSIEEARRFVSDLAGVMTLALDPSPPYPAVCRDPGDDYLVALARAALVDALVTGDRDLLKLQDTGVTVITPRELIERLADAP